MVEAQEMQPIDGVMSGVQLVTDCPRCQARWRLKVAVAVLYALCFILLFSLVVLGCVAWKQLEEASSEMQELFVEHGDINGTGEVTKGEWQREMDTLAEVRALLDEVRSEMDESNRDLIWQRSQLTQLHGQQLALKGSLSDMHADILQLKDKLEMFAKRLQSITDTHKDISAAQAMLGGPPWKTTWMENAHLKQDLAWTKTSLVEQANALQVLEFVIEHLEWAQSEAGEIWMKVHDGLLRNVLLLESMHRDALEYNSAVIQGSLLSLDNAKSFDAILSTLNEHSVQVDNVTFTVSIHKDNMEDLMEHMEFVRNRTHDYFDTINGTLDLQNLEVHTIEADVNGIDLHLRSLDIYLHSTTKGVLVERSTHVAYALAQAAFEVRSGMTVLHIAQHRLWERFSKAMVDLYIAAQELRLINRARSSQVDRPDFLKGLSGDPGHMGDPGTDGTSGLTGMTGSPGDFGDTSSMGLPGIKGATGPFGSGGVHGSRGRTGKKGQRGALGFPGVKGVSGLPVSVKWGKEKLQGVPVDTESPPWVFKSQLSELTGVSPHRQRVLIRGVALKDDEWGKFQIKDGSTLLLMGSVEELPNAPAERPMFVEDFSEAHLANVMDLPTGLVNLGNTCYLNATVQCLRKVPELREALKRYKGSVQTTAIANQAESITAALRDLFDSLERDAQAVPPITLLQLLHLACPQFAQEEDGGEYMLQDARECWQELMNRLTKLPSWEDHKEDKPQDKSFVEEFFGLELCSFVTCGESKEASDVTSNKEKRLHLRCVANEDATTLEAGLRQGLVDELIESCSHGKAGMSFTEFSQICRLPTYLVIVLDCKRGQDAGTDSATLLPKVTFPMNLDVLPLCSASLKRSSLTQRQRKGEDAGKLSNIESTAQRTLQAFDILRVDTGATSNGLYKLRAVISYDRSSVPVGHYLAWLSGKKGDWIKCNDTNMEVVCEQDVHQLCGVESPHTACVFLYVSEPTGMGGTMK